MEASPAVNRLDRATLLALVAMGLGVFVIANDFTALSVAIPEIESDLDAGLSQSQWVINGYSVVFGVLIITGGMRGTASHDVVLEDVFVPADRVMGRRPWGEFGVPLTAAAVHFAPVGGATYLGIAMGARDAAVARATATSRGPNPLAGLPRVHRQVGLMDAKLRVAWWALLGAVDELGDDYAVDPQALAMVMIAKRQAVIDAIAVVDLAMDVLGGRAYFRSVPLERAYRDVRAGTFHPLTPEATLAYAGKLALGDSGVTE
jgi:alkylation response protein AidB-like acyl-CoA dehydrogenase